MDAKHRAAIIVCESVHHGNTRRVAEAMAKVLGADVVTPAELNDPGRLTAFDLVGFGSGIYFGRHHRSLRKFVDRLPDMRKNVFLFSTAGLPWFHWLWHLGLRWKLRRKGARIVGEFACMGWDTVGPLALIGGLNRRHPSEKDLSRAASFATQLLCHDP